MGGMYVRRVGIWERRGGWVEGYGSLLRVHLGV